MNLGSDHKQIMWLLRAVIIFLKATESSQNTTILVFGSDVMKQVKTVSKRMSLYKWPLQDLFWPFFRHMCVHISQNWGSDSHSKVLNRSYLWLVQKLWHKTQTFPFFLQFSTSFAFFCAFFFVITFVAIKI